MRYRNGPDTQRAMIVKLKGKRCELHLYTRTLHTMIIEKCEFASRMEAMSALRELLGTTLLTFSDTNMLAGWAIPPQPCKR